MKEEWFKEGVEDEDSYGDDLYGAILANLEGVEEEADTRDFGDIDFCSSEERVGEIYAEHEKDYMTGDNRQRSPLGEYVKKYREKCYLSQAQLARKVGTTHASISAIETGRIHPKKDKADRIAAGIGVDKDEFWKLVSFSRSKVTGRLFGDATLTAANIKVPLVVLDWYRSNALRRRKTLALVLTSTLVARYKAETGKDI